MEVQHLYDELERQVHESKLKLDASTEIIQKLENEVNQGQDAIVSIVQLFE